MQTIIKYFFQCLKWFSRYKILFLINVILNLVSVIVHLIEPYIYASVITYLFGSEWPKINKAFIFLLLCFMLKTAISYISSKLEIMIRKKVAYHVKIELMQKMAAVKPAMINDYDDGRLFSIMINDSLLICNYVYSISSYLSDILTIILIGIILFSANFLLALAVLAVFPISYQINKKYGKRINLESTEIYKKTDSVIGLIKNLINNLNDIKINNAGKIMLAKFDSRLDDTITHTIYRDNIQLKASVLTSIINFTGNFFFLILGCALVFKNRLLPGTFVAFSSYAKMFNSSLFSISTLYSRFQQEIVGIGRIMEFDNVYQEFLKAEAGKVMPASLQDSISFHDITLEINNKIILSGLNLRIPHNKSLALIGSNGSGKTSILNILAGIYHPSYGNVYFDGTNTDNILYSWLQENIGYVRQSPVIYPISIKDNMTFSSKNELTSERLIEICRDVQIYDDIADMPEQFETIIDERYHLSAGQQKKVQLVRIILKDAPVILLDEPLSNLDASFNKNYHNLYNKYFKGKTVIAATHEHNTLDLYDDVLLISEGKLARRP